MADSFKTFPSLAFTASLQHTQRHLSTCEVGKAGGLIRHFLKTKELDIWLLLVLLLPSSQLQNKPEPYRAPLLTPRLGGGKGVGKCGEGENGRRMGVDRAPSLQGDPASQALH